MLNQMEDFFVLEHIKKLLNERSWSVYRLSKESNIAQSSLNAMLKGNHVPTIYNLIKICNGFGMSLSQFFDGIEHIEQETDELVKLISMLDEKQRQIANIYISGLLNVLP